MIHRMADDVQTKILLAAATVAARGVTSFTIDAVAKEAGVSKGGVLHYFPTKELLGVALVEAALEGFEKAVATIAATLEGRLTWTRAFLRVSVTLLEDSSSSSGLARAFLVAASPESPLNEPVRQYYIAWTARMDAETQDPVLAVLVRCVADGCWWADILNTSPLSISTRAALVDYVDSLLAPV
jgi:AcrR family transcriptional regulator